MGTGDAELERIFSDALISCVEARLYMRARGMDPVEATRYGVGFCPPAQERAPGQLRGRLTFTIRNERGEICGFAGRAIRDQCHPKYITTAGARIGSTLFGIESAIGARTIVIVEGYMDSIAARTAGLSGVVAMMGASLSPAQLRLAAYASADIVVIPDADHGADAVLRSTVSSMLSTSIPVRWGTLPASMDPADLILQRGADALLSVIAAARPLSHVVAQYEMSGSMARTARGFL